MIFQDQIGEKIHLPSVPERIVSLVPSQTELLADLGLGDRVVGITKFCIYPNDWFRSKTRIGGTKAIDIDKVRSLEPDLIIGNKEENTKQDIEALREIAPVWISDVNSKEDALNMIRSIGDIASVQEKAKQICRQIEDAFEELFPSDRKRVIYYIWHDPDYAAGRKTFIHSMLEECGFENALIEERYPEINDDLDPDLVLLSSEPYPFKEEHIKAFQNKHPNAKVRLVDGEMFSWYGSRMRLAPQYFSEILKSI